MSIFNVSVGESLRDKPSALQKEFQEYVSTDIDEIFGTPSKKWFVKYEPLDSTKEYLIHPGADIVESYPLSFVKPPVPSEDGLLMPDNGELTTVQMDAVRLASARFRETFADTGVTKGFLLADGPGIGKTRILAATIYNEFLNGHKRHIFLTISDILFHDVVSEFEKVASTEWASNHIKTLEQLESTRMLHEFEGVLFMTYHRLRKTGASGPIPSSVSRLSGIDVIKNFCGRENPFQGVIALDESHVGKNALNPILDLRSTTGQIMLNVLDTYKEAKIIYSTATPASNANHFGILSRLGIWGSEKYFTGFQTFDKLMGKWELSAAELMALLLKKEGAMVCRQISFEGVETIAEYIPAQSEPQCFRENYDMFSEMWRRMYKDIIIIARYCDPDSKKTKIATFFSGMMNFFRALIIDSKINQLVKMIVNEIENDNVVVVGIQNTGEAAYADYKRNEERDELISNAKEIMEKLVKNHFCVAMHSRKLKVKKDEGDDESSDDNSENVVAEALVETNENSTLEDDLFLSGSDDEDDNEAGPPAQSKHERNRDQPARSIVYSGTNVKCVDIPEVTKIREDWLDKIRKIKHMPPNFLDEIQRRLSEFSNITVAEITGRRQQLKSKNGRYELVDRPIDCDFERKLFMEGKANVAIISDAGSTGISLHASNAREDYCKKIRVHITVELGWSAEKVLQQLGRTNRANQKQPPKYVFLQSNVPSEIRFTSIILGRLSTMSTFTCAQRHVDLCHRLEQQAKYDSNAGIRGIRAALSFFFDEDVPIPYDQDVDLKYKVSSQLNLLGLTTSKKEKISFVKAQGRTLKRINLTKIMNKLLGCSLDVQKVFCDVWLFYLSYFERQYNKDKGVVVVNPNVCTVIAEKKEILQKRNEPQDVLTQSTVIPEQQVGNVDVTETLNVTDSLERICQSKPSSHGPIHLIMLHACLGSTAMTIKNLYDTIPESDKISGFYHDGNFPRLNHLRYFYLQNKILDENYQNNLLNKKELPQTYSHKIFSVLYQPHQPPMELTGEKTAEFLKTMSKVLLGNVAMGQWLQQASALKDNCIHKYSLGIQHCESPLCSRGKRHDVKFIVEGDLPAIWSDILSILKDEDPSLVVCKDSKTKMTYIGIEIPKHAITSFQMKIAGHDFYALGT